MVVNLSTVSRPKLVFSVVSIAEFCGEKLNQKLMASNIL